MGKNNESSGMGTVMKVFIGVVLAGAVLMVIVCGGGYWFARNAFKPTSNPTEIAAITSSIATIPIPEGYVPKGGMQVSMGMTMKMAAYEKSGPPKGDLVIMEMGVPGQVLDDKTRDQFKRTANENRSGNNDVTVTSTETKKITIDGQERDFEFVTGETSGSKQPIHEVTGASQARVESASWCCAKPATAGTKPKS
jgi:hypothetical protein